MIDSQDRRLQVDGFGLGGYRSFHGPLQLVGPLEKVTLLVGHNSSGKSNVLRAAQAWFPVLKASSQVQMSPLDVPILEAGADPPRPVAAIARRIEGDLEGAVAETFGHPQGLPGLGSNERATLRAIVQSGALRDGDADVIWFRFRVGEDGRFAIDPDLANAVLAEMSPHDVSNVGRLSSTLRSQASDAESDLSAILLKWAQLDRLPRVDIVPAARSVQRRTDGGSEVAFTGEGLVDHLMTLQAPRAETYRSDREKFARINRFVKDVLEDPDAELSVPYDSQDVHVSLGGADRPLPLANHGTGIAQVVLIATLATLNDGQLLAIEEPETHVHPTMLRKLVRYLRDRTNNQYLIATHSAALLDDPTVGVVRVNYDASDGTTTEAALTGHQRGRLSAHLGFRSSDLLQSNAILWVEGPSDRVYLNHWIWQREPRFREGVHYSIMFYGGKLLSRVTGGDIDTSDDLMRDFVSLIRINRNMAILMDSDKAKADEEIRTTKSRLLAELSAAGMPRWVTAGREIENYIPLDVFRAACKVVHPGVEPATARGQFSKRFAGIPRPNKVRVAEEIVKTEDLAAILDLETRMDVILALLYRVNDLG